jgi:hypothetical protein
VYKDKTYGIWDYNYSVLKQLFTEKNLNFKYYAPVGHVYLNNGDFKLSNILFANRQYAPIAQKFKFVATLSKGSLWEPILDDDNYAALGLVYSDDITAPKSEMALIRRDMIHVNETDTKYVTPFKGVFNLVNHTNVGRIKLLTNKLYKSSKIFRLFNKDGKYLTEIDGSAKMKDRIDQQNQAVSYNAQGELTVGGKCLRGKNYEISLETCNGSREQRWLRKEDGYRTFDDDSCLTSDNENISLKPCDDSDDTNSLYVENQESDDSNIYVSRSVTNNKYKGKNVVLVEAENPWYANKDVTVIQNAITPDSELTDIEYDFGAFKSNFNIDARRKDLGYGSSYASRQGEPCIEGFDESENRNILFILCILMVFLILYKIKW